MWWGTLCFIIRMRSKKGLELSLSTVIIFLIAVIVLVVAVLMLLKVSNPISDMFRDQATKTIEGIPKR